MLVFSVLFGAAFFTGAVWLLPSQIMLATANRRFRHLNFHTFVEAEPFPYHASRRLLIAGLGAGVPPVAVLLVKGEAAALLGAAAVFVCFVALSVSDFIWVERAATRLERDGKDISL